MFVVPLLIARFLAPEEFGIYSLSIMIIYFFTALFINSSQKPFIVYGNEELAQRNTINRTFTIRIIFLTLSVVLFSLLSLLFITPLSSFASLSKTQYLFLFAAYIGMAVRFTFETGFLALKNKTAHVWYGIAAGIISILFVLVLYLFEILILEYIFLMFLLAPILAIPFVWKWVDTTKLFPLEFDKRLFIKMFHYTKWTMLGGTAVYLISWGDNLVLRYFVSLEEIGFYNLGYQLFKGTLILIGVTGTYFLPFLTQHVHNRKKIHSYLYTKRPKILALGVAGLILFFLLIPLFFKFFYGDTYTASIQVVQLLLIASLFVLYQSFYVPILDALERYKFTQSVNVVLVLINLGLDVLFVAYMGMMGATVATVITYIISTILYEAYFRMKCKRKLLNQ